MSGSHRGRVLAIVCAIGFLNFLDRMILAAMMPAIRSEFSLADAQLGLLSTMFGIVYAIAGLPLGRATDRFARNRLISIAAALWSLATAACGLASSFGALLLARMGVAFGEAAFVPAAFSTLSDLFAPNRRYLATSALIVAMSLGTLAGLTAGGALADAYGWRTAFFLAGLPGLVLAVLGWFILREPARGAHDTRADGEPVGLRDTLAALARNRPFLWLILTNGLNGFSAVGIVQWLPSHFARTFSVSLGQIGFAFGLAFGIGTCVGQLIGGLAAARLARRGTATPLLLCVGSNALIVPGFAAVLLVGGMTTASLLTFVTTVIAATGQVAQNTGVQNAVLARQRGVAQALAGLSVAVMGMGVGPLLVGALSDHLAVMSDPATALRQALLCSQAFFVLASFTAWRAYRASKALEG